MRILHIGDFHYKTKGNNYEQSLMVDSFITSLKNKEKIDFIFFSGDLVNSGVKEVDFTNAYKCLLLPISSSLNIPEENIIICPGNHDINRDECTKGVILYFDKEVNDNRKLDQEVLQKSKDYEASTKSIQNYIKFIKEKKNNADDIINDLYTIHIRTVDNEKIGILTLNTAWLSCGFREDLNFLQFPTNIIKDAIDHLNDNKITNRIILLHHPFSYFKEYNAIELEDIINKEFSMMFTGHVHKEHITAKYAGKNGIYSNTTQASLAFDQGAEIGYSIIDYNIAETFSENDDCNQNITLYRATYNRKEATFIDLETVSVSIPCGIEKANQNKLRRKITSKFRYELNQANELLLDYDDISRLDFLDVFTNPLLTTQIPSQSATKESKGEYNFEDLYTSENNYLIFGKDKCGKTSLLKKLMLYYIKNYSALGKIPLYLDYKDLANRRDSSINIASLLCNYYEINYADAESIISKSNLVLLLDNLDTNSDVNTHIVDFLECTPQIRFIIASDYLASRIYFEELDHLDYSKLYFNDLTRKEIRLYTDKVPTIKASQRENALERITVLCKQLQLPMNYWTVSLILLIYKRSNEDYNKNLYGILDLCVDEILQKKQLLFSKNKMTFNQYKEMGAQIAYYLLTEHRDNVYSASYIELITFLENIIKDSPRLVVQAKDIFDYFSETGLIKEKHNRYTFRLNGVFEYFLAYYLSHNPAFKKELLADDRIYLTFKNELEIYSGLVRNDVEFVTNIFQKTKTVFDKLIEEHVGSEKIDSVLTKKYNDSREFSNIVKELRVNNPIKHEIQDAIKDTTDPLSTMSEVHVKELIDTEKLTPENLETYITILSRVFKNSDNISTELVYQIFDYLLDAYCVFGYYLLDEMSEYAKNENLNSKNGEFDFVIGEELLKTLTNFIPTLTQSMMFEGLGHITISKIIESRIEKYKQDYSNNQYRLFILYYLLIDLDIKAYKHLVDDIFKYITLNPLKVSTFFKMSFYHAFKAYKNKELENFFKQKMKEAQLKMDNKLDTDQMNSFLSKKQKRNIVRKGRER